MEIWQGDLTLKHLGIVNNMNSMKADIVFANFHTNTKLK